LESDSDFDKLFSEAFEGMEDQFKEHPEKLKIYKKFLKQQFLSYAGESNDEYPPLADQVTKTDKSKLQQVTKKKFPECIPLSDKRIKMNFPHQYSAEEFHRMSYGLAPASMDEKWIVLAEGLTLGMYRSWPPIKCIYEIHFQKSGDIYRVKEAWVDKAFLDEPWNNPGYSAELLHYIVQRMLLGHGLPFPFPNSINGSMEKSMFRHGMVGSSLANDER